MLVSPWIRHGALGGAYAQLLLLPWAKAWRACCLERVCPGLLARAARRPCPAALLLLPPATPATPCVCRHATPVAVKLLLGGEQIGAEALLAQMQAEADLML